MNHLFMSHLHAHGRQDIAKQLQGRAQHGPRRYHDRGIKVSCDRLLSFCDRRAGGLQRGYDRGIKVSYWSLIPAQQLNVLATRKA